MAKRKKNLRSLDESGWQLSDRLREYMRERFPELDPDGTAEIFSDKALANDWVYADWDAAFRNYLRKSKEWGGVAYREGLDDPKWRPLLLKARDIGFREPRLPVETPAAYRAAMDAWQPELDVNNPVTALIRKNVKAVPR